MRPEGLEPPRVAPPAPKAGASANSATVAKQSEMYTFRGRDGVPFISWSLHMFGRFIRTVIPLVVLSAGPLAVPTFAQVADQQKICSLVENRGFTVGKWSSNNWTGGDATARNLRIAVVGKEP